MPNMTPLFTCCRKSGGGNPDHAWMQGSELWNLAVRRQRRKVFRLIFQRKASCLSVITG
jgi:hypothetical protein